MKNKLLLIIVLLAIAANVDAQTIKGFAVSMKFGYMGAPGSASVFTKISKPGIDGFTNNYAAFGGEGYYRTGQMIFGMEGIMGTQKVYSSGFNYAEPFLGAGHLRFGYIINNNINYWFYPSVGTGVSMASLSTYSKIYDSEKNQNDYKMQFSPSFDMGMNADFMINKVSSETRNYGAFLLGIKTGYRFSFIHDYWFNTNGNEMINAPSYGNNAFYITLSIGGGYFWRKG